MVYNEIGYHGTEQANCESILQDGFRPSSGERHWLGDGVYFFTEAFYAYKWRYDKCQADAEERGGKPKLDCYIIKAQIHTSEERVFDLTKFIHHYEFQEWLEKIETLKPRSRWARKAVPEGVVLNYLFNESGDKEYREQYDVVKAMFQWPSTAYRPDGAKLPPGLPQMQLCVKNERTPSGELTIQDIAVYDYRRESVHFETLRQSFEAQKRQGPRPYPGKRRNYDSGTGRYRKT
jgi:hypothetical protein